jgi:hypothetical protein
MCLVNNRRRALLLPAFAIAWLLLCARVSTPDEHGMLHDDHNAELANGHDQLSAQHANGLDLIYVEHGADRNISRELTADQRRRYEEEKQGDFQRERQNSRERSDDATRYYWWWPFRR